ncbi:MAG: hypothetical protein EAZ11_02615 [Curvibacter sp.]|nr:MAG: hypothetical protein EAZ11_02615 [Curvibacter sp.]
MAGVSVDYLEIDMNKGGKAALVSGLCFFLIYVLVLLLDLLATGWGSDARDRYFALSEYAIFFSGGLWIVLLARFWFKKNKLI